VFFGDMQIIAAICEIFFRQRTGIRPAGKQSSVYKKCDAAGKELNKVLLKNTLFSVKQFCFSICSVKSAPGLRNAEQPLKKD